MFTIASLEVLLITQRKVFVKHTTLGLIECKNKRKIMLLSQKINETCKNYFEIKQEAHGPHGSPEKTVQINKHIKLS